MSSPVFKVVYDFRPPATATLQEVLRWRKWSKRERGIIRDVIRGRAPRFSTSHDGQFCDLTLDKELADAD